MKKILYTIVILGGLIGFFFFSTPGLNILKGLPDAHKGASWAPFAYYNIARLREAMGRLERAGETYQQMLDTYDANRNTTAFVKNNLSRHYVPYALFRRAVCLEKLGDNEYNQYTGEHAKGQETEAYKSLALSEDHYGQAYLLFREFVYNYNDHKLYSEANRHLNDIQIKGDPLP